MRAIANATARLLPALVLTAGSALAADPPFVANSAEPRDGYRDVTLQQQWSAGGEDDDENIFGVITAVLADAAGDVYVLDQQLSQVAVFSPDGERKATLSREGTGPGEIQRPNGMFFLPDGKLGIVQVFPGKIVQIDTDGNPAGTFPFAAGDPAAGGFAVLVNGRSRGGTIALCGIRQTFDAGKLGQSYFLESVDASGATTGTFATKSAEQDFANLVLDEIGVDFIWSRWDVAPDGDVLVAPARNEYRIERRAPDGSLRFSFGRPYETYARDADDRARAEAMLNAQGRNYPTPPKVVVADTEEDITLLDAMSDGSVWVLTSRGVRNQPDGVMATYDVFDADGVFVNRTRVHADANGLEDRLFLIGPDRAVLVRNLLGAFLASQGADTGSDESAEPMEVVSCRIVR